MFSSIPLREFVRNRPHASYLLYSPLKGDAVELTQQDDGKGFFLKHVDGKDDHLLVDENLNITSIMIWYMVRVVLRLEASSPPVSANMTDCFMQQSCLVECQG